MLQKFRPTSPSLRRGVVALEFVMIFPFLMMLCMASWEVANLIQAQRRVEDAARAGGRAAAAARIVSGGQDLDVTFSTNGPGQISVERIVLDALDRSFRRASGFFAAYATVQVENLDNPGVQPFQATQLDRFEVVVTVPRDSVRWIGAPVGPDTPGFMGGPAVVNGEWFFGKKDIVATTVWRSTVDIPLTVNTTIPNPGD